MVRGIFNIITMLQIYRENILKIGQYLSYGVLKLDGLFLRTTPIYMYKVDHVF